MYTSVNKGLTTNVAVDIFVTCFLIIWENKPKPGGLYKTFFILNSAEHEIYLAHKS